MRKVVTLCGSTKFRKEYEEATFKETMDGNIVLSVGCFMHHDQVPITAEQKWELDQLHFRKIAMSDEILVINPGGYIGLSTCDEIGYAMAFGKAIRWTDQAREVEEFG